MSENWIRVSIFTTPDGIEPLYGALLSYGFESVEICDEGDFFKFLEENKSKWDYVDDDVITSKKEPTHLNVFLRENTNGKEQIAVLNSCLENLKKTDIGIDLGSLEVQFADVGEDSWFEKWKKYYKPLEIGKNILVVPKWIDDPPTNRKILKINPGMLFGTGSHNTTRLCMEFLENTVKRGDCVADIGCGSGILSILSLVLGAEFASAVDIDPAAVHIAYENASYNGIGKENYFVTSGNILEEAPFANTPADRLYDIVVANIVADVIIPLSAIVPKYMKPNALFLTSGIINHRFDDCVAAFKENGFNILEARQDGEWHAVLSERK
ncbi:MAG: 50S ribosomal protein L11 methyltransferase [Clostridia bacterium]|nr:50S ribosomal protein L11 methyltransferase [Clostridia bacterium]